MSIKRVGALCMAGLISAAALPVQAQEETGQRGVTVTATRAERELLEVPASVSSVSSEEIRRGGAAVVAEALRDIPGVEVHDGSVSGAKRVFIRGESGARVLILIDGQKTSEQKAMTGAVFLMDPALIERIEIIKGPSSVLYGSEAIGGVVNIITKKGGERPVQVDVGISYDSSTEGTRQHLSVYGKSGRMGYRVGGAWSDHDDRDTPGGTADGTAYKESSIFAYIDYQGDDFVVGGRYDTYNGDYRTYVPEGTISGTMEHFAQDLPEWSREKVSFFYEAEHLSDALVKLRADAYAQNTYKDFRMDMDVRPMPAVQIPLQMRNRTENDQDTYGLAVQTDWLVADDHYVIAGVELIQDRLKADEFRRQRGPWAPMPPFNAQPQEFVESSYTNKAKSDFYALYVQDEWSLNPDTILTLGLRQTWARNELTSAEEPGLEEDSSRDSKLVYSIGLTWQGLEDTALRTSYSQGYRLPTLQQLFIGTVHGSQNPTYSNPDLKPETSDNVEIGLRHFGQNLLVDAALFASKTEDYITTAAHPTINNANTFANVDKASTHGMEVAVAYLVESLNLTPYGSATWLKRKFESEDLNTWKTGNPELQGRIGLRHERAIAAGVDANLDAYVRAAGKAERENSDGTIDTDDSWQTLNLTMGFTFGSRQQYELNLNLNNLTDEKYTVSQESIPMAGRHFVVGISGAF